MLKVGYDWWNSDLLARTVKWHDDGCILHSNRLYAPICTAQGYDYITIIRISI